MPSLFFKSFSNTSDAEAAAGGPGGSPHSEEVSESSAWRGGAGDDGEEAAEDIGVKVEEAGGSGSANARLVSREAGQGFKFSAAD